MQLLDMASQKNPRYMCLHQRLNMKLDLWAPCAQLYSLAETPQPPPPAPRIWAHMRGRYWSAKKDDISLWPPGLQHGLKYKSGVVFGPRCGSENGESDGHCLSDDEGRCLFLCALCRWELPSSLKWWLRRDRFHQVQIWKVDGFNPGIYNDWYAISATIIVETWKLLRREYHQPHVSVFLLANSVGGGGFGEIQPDAIKHLWRANMTYPFLLLTGIFGYSIAGINLERQRINKWSIEYTIK